MTFLQIVLGAGTFACPADGMQGKKSQRRQSLHRQNFRKNSGIHHLHLNQTFREERIDVFKGQGRERNSTQHLFSHTLSLEVGNRVNLRKAIVVLKFGP